MSGRLGKYLRLGAVVFCTLFVGAWSAGKDADGERAGHVHLCTFLPENDLYIPVDAIKVNATGMTEQEFNRVIDTVERIYKPIFQQLGKQLVFKRSWANGQVNAQAFQQGNIWYVEMFGGLARHPAVTSDALALVACHEIGHHVGGAPRYTSGGNWASVEGQSDYFATTKCLRKVFAADGGMVAQVDPIARQECNRIYGNNTADSLICQRIVMAGVSSGNMFGQLSGRMPSLAMKDPSQVQRTYESHPQAQCRLDTYFQGAICDISHAIDFDARNPDVGACLNFSQKDYGARPLCWYKPANSNPMPTPTPQPTPTPWPLPTPTPTPNPGDLAVAPSPKLNGQAELQWTNPAGPITILYDVSHIPNVYGVFFEISRPNMPLQRNGIAEDRTAWRSFSIVGARNQFMLVPQAVLPGWGTYQIRLIPLDRSGRIPLGQFSDPAKLIMTPQIRYW